MVTTKKTENKPRKRPTPIRRGVQSETIGKVAEKVEAAQAAEILDFEQRQIPLANVHIWEDQPRTVYLKVDDVCRGSIPDDDKHALNKNEELLEINSLALSIAKLGLLNPPLAYALPGKAVQLIGGERRTLASIYALFHITTSAGPNGEIEYETVINDSPDLSLLETEKMVIKVFPRKPDELELERISMADNAHRKDLPIPDKLSWSIRYADKKNEAGQEVEFRELVATLGLSRSRAFAWLKVLKARHDKWVSLVIDKVLQNKIDFKKLETISDAEATEREALYKEWFESPAQDSTFRVSLGACSNSDAIRTLVLKNAPHNNLTHFENIDWTKPKAAKKGFAEFLKLWEEQHDR